MSNSRHTGRTLPTIKKIDAAGSFSLLPFRTAGRAGQGFRPFQSSKTFGTVFFLLTYLRQSRPPLRNKPVAQPTAGAFLSARLCRTRCALYFQHGSLETFRNYFVYWK
jgi:hypothetical protein